MNHSLGLLLLTLTTSFMLAIPLIPSLIELHRRRDAGPITVQQHANDIEDFARSFRDFIGPMLPTLDRCRETGTNQRLVTPDQAGVWLVGSGHVPALLPYQFDELMLCAVPMTLSPQTRFTKDVYAAQRLKAGRETVFRAVCCDQDISLEAKCRVLRWMHSEGEIRSAEGSIFDGRLSSNRSIELGRGCRFGRVYAPRIRAAGDGALPHGSESKKPVAMSSHLQRWRSRNSIYIESGCTVINHLISE